MFSILQSFSGRRELLFMLVSRNLKIRYKNSFLGFFWSLLGPLFLILIYALFLGVMKFDIPLPVLVTGIFVWQFLGTCLGDSLHAIVGNASLVTKAAFPRLILPAATVTANLVNFLLSSIVLLLYLCVVRADFGAVYWLPLIVLSQFALCMGVSLLICTANVFFRDTEHIMSILTLAWFFLTPVIYPLQVVRDRFVESPWIVQMFFLNPMTGILTAYRMVFLSARGPGWSSLALSFGGAWLILVAGTVVFLKCEPRFGDEL